jgi:Fungal specific transcription factor domain
MVAGTPPIIELHALTGTEYPDIPPSLIHSTSNKLTLLEFGEEIMSLIRFMSDLSVTQSAMISTPGVTAEEIIAFNKLRTAAEHRLLSIRVSQTTNSRRNQLEAAVYEACRISALMCSNCIFREFTPRAVAYRGLKEGFLSAIAEIETFGDLEQARDFEELLLWVYFIGGMILTSEDTAWFARRVARAMANLGFENWDAVEQCMARCLWAEKMHNKYCLAFWEGVVKCGEFSEGAADVDILIQEEEE